ncbi:MAG: AAA family ATPase [Bryobacteraceae bacterium]|jgi:predicted ATPase
MYLQVLKVNGFTSFKEVAWAPQRLNVLIGPNGSGKSNLLRAFELIRASAVGALRDFVLAKGGSTRLLWGGTAPETLFEIAAESGPQSTECPVYFFRLVPRSASLRVEAESLVFAEPSSPKVQFLSRDGDELTVREGNDDLVLGPAEHVAETETALSMVSAFWRHRVPYQFQQYLKAWAIYHDLRVDEHAEIRRPAVVREGKRISPDGQNLTPVLTTLYEGDFKDAIDSGMSAAFPDDYQELIFRETEPNRVQLYVRRKHSHREDSVADLSDGTLRFLLLLTILATPDPPPLIAIDEPESGLHPSMLPIIAEFAAEAATRTQVVLSTHSPQMLDAFGDALPATTVFNWAEDHTELKTVTGEELKKWVADYSLGRFIFSGEAAAVL